MRDAQYNLGKAFYDGMGVLPKYERQAVEWLRKAAEQGNALAQNGLGLMSFAGQGCCQK